MKTNLLFFGFVVISLFALNSCGLGEAKTEAQAAAKIFHKHMRNRDHESMVNMIHSEGLTLTPKEEWLKLFKGLDVLGKIKNIKQDMSFHTSIENGVTTVELNYTIDYIKRTMNEQLILKKEGKTFKLIGYSIN